MDSVHLCMSENKSLMGIRVLIFTTNTRRAKDEERKIKVCISGIEEEEEEDLRRERKKEAFIIISQERRRESQEN